VGVIPQKGPCVAAGSGFWQQLGKPLREIFAVPVIRKNLSPLDASDHDMMQEAWRIQSCASGHVWKVCEYSEFVNYLII